jgi:hypothetical protein
MQIKNQWAYLITIIILAAALLVGNRFDARWAGGDGYAVHQLATSQEQVWKRGELISSEDTSTFTLGNATVYLDDKTEIKLIDGREGDEMIQLIQGRVYVDGEIGIIVREVTTYSPGTISVVHYSWLDEIDVLFFDETSHIITPGFTLFANAIDATMVKMNTLNYEYTEYDFEIEGSASEDFYQRILD